MPLGSASELENSPATFHDEMREESRNRGHLLLLSHEDMWRTEQFCDLPCAPQWAEMEPGQEMMIPVSLALLSSLYGSPPSHVPAAVPQHSHTPCPSISPHWKLTESQDLLLWNTGSHRGTQSSLPQHSASWKRATS